MAGFDLRSAHVRRVVVKVALGQIFVPVLRFSRSVSFHQCYILICIYTLLLAERQTGEAWEPSRKQCASGSREALDRKLSQFSWATLLVADLPPRGHGLYLALFHVGHSGQRVCCMFCGYPLSALFHQCYVLISTSILLSEGRAIEVWDPSKKQCSVGCRGALEYFDMKSLGEIFTSWQSPFRGMAK